MSTLNADVRDITDKYDIVMLYAVIHWIYSCTSDFGSLRNIISFLSNICNETLFIEWVDPSDVAIKYFKHINFNPDTQTEPYDKEHFVRALHENFPYVKNIGKVRNSREIWVASRKMLDFDIPNYINMGYSHSSVVYIDPTKTFVIKNYKNNEYDCFERELYWLEKLQNLDFVPRLISVNKDDMYLVLSYVGERVDMNNTPPNFIEQCKNILQQLKEQDCYPRDVKITKEVLVKNDRVYICDFCWCPTLDMDYTINGKFSKVSDQILNWIPKELELINIITK